MKPFSPKATRVTVAFAALAGVLLGGCSTISDLNPFESKRLEYKSAQSGPALEIPPDLSPPRYDDRYRAGTATLSGVNAANRAAVLSGAGGVLPVVSGMRVERSGTERWLVVPGTPEANFPRIREFWSSMNLTLVTDDARVGLMETDWAENRARILDDPIRRVIGKVFDNVYSSGTRDKYRTRVERGAAGTTEIFISHRGMEEKSVGTQASPQFRWEPRKSEPEYEAEILYRLMTYLGAPKAEAAQLAQAAVAPASAAARVDQATIVKTGSQSMLSINDGFDRAWRRVGLALDRVGFTVVDRDRTAGTYFVRYADPEQIAKNEPGILDKLKFWQSDNKDVAEQYRITVKENAGKTEMRVLDKSGQPDTTPIGARIVTLLYEQLR
ncbi:MAG: outer membrane protein assembly factor BamC [Burkholderiales bacterium]|nr:outer membrane protein assembly factor BamC [Burkholderiales bacterium]